jgi:hypothetical protein
MLQCSSPRYCLLWMQRFIIIITDPHQWPLFGTSWNQITRLHPIAVKSLLISSSHLCLGLPSSLFLSVVTTFCIHFSLSSCRLHAYPHDILFNCYNSIMWEVQTLKLFCLPPPVKHHARWPVMVSYFPPKSSLDIQLSLMKLESLEFVLPTGCCQEEASPVGGCHL